MIVKQILDEDFVNYKKPAMFIAFPCCDWKCEFECGKRVCQNGTLATSPDIEIEREEIVTRYINNKLTSAVVIGGLEPFFNYHDLIDLVASFRAKTDDDIVIYTGYYEEEIRIAIETLQEFNNIIIKYGRFRPDNKPHYDDVLGVNLASDNQYAVRLKHRTEG